MSFSDASAYMQDSLAVRYDRMAAGKKQLWFTSQVTSYDDLFEKFDRGEETSEWEAIKDKDDLDEADYMSLKLKIGWLGGQQRDLRTLYICGGDNHPRSPTDDNRFSLARIGFINFILEKLIEILS